MSTPQLPCAPCGGGDGLSGHGSLLRMSAVRSSGTSSGSWGMDAATRNHRHPSMKALMDAVRRCIEVIHPWPGSAHAFAKA